jgi:B12-binding domain/radical SAM domain protein
MDRLALILPDAKSHRHSLNALVGALETDRELDVLELRLPKGEAQLAAHIAEVCASGKRPVVGLSFTTPQLWHRRDLLLRLKARSSGAEDRSQVLWIAGGPHPTADPEGTLRLGFDVAVRGEGEATLLELLKTLATGGDLANVAGVVVRDASGKSQATGRRAPIDLDAFPPFPLWRRRVVGPIEITRGCPFVCAYCQTSHLQGVQPRHRSIETIARYAGVIRQRGLRDVRVVTPNAFSYGSPDGKTMNFPAMEALLVTLRQTLGRDGRLYFGSFPSEVRPEHVDEATVELVTRYANNDNLVIGAQSGSEKVLAHCGRGHSVAQVFSAVRCTLAAGLKPQVDFIFGLPGETIEDLKCTMEVIRELASMGALIHAHTFMPLPQTRFAHEPPGQIHGRLRPFIRELIRNGSLHGVWHKQEREAKRISRYIQDGEL